MVLIYKISNQFGMLVNYSLGPSDDFSIVSHSVTLVPRLEYSVNLLSEIIETLSEKKSEIKESNKDLASFFDEKDAAHLESLELERTCWYCHEVLYVVKKRASGINGITSLPEVLPSVIQMIRTISARLYEILPDCSQKLSELSVHLGSIVMDSAALTKARFDFRQSNEESASVLDKVKLMTNSKMCKSYPNVGFLKTCDT